MQRKHSAGAYKNQTGSFRDALCLPPIVETDMNGSDAPDDSSNDTKLTEELRERKVEEEKCSRIANSTKAVPL